MRVETTDILHSTKSDAVSEPPSLCQAQEVSKYGPVTPAACLNRLTPDASLDHGQVCLKCWQHSMWSGAPHGSFKCQSLSLPGLETAWNERNMRCSSVEKDLFMKQPQVMRNPSQEFKESMLQLTSHITSNYHLNSRCNCGENEIGALKELSRSIAELHTTHLEEPEKGELILLAEDGGKQQWPTMRPASPSDTSQADEETQLTQEEDTVRPSTEAEEEAAKGMIWTYDPVQGVYRLPYSRDDD